MSWRDRIQPATFRGVPFYVDAIERTGGRRGPTHKYAFRDDQYAEDMGGDGNTFPVEGYVLGDEYLAARDKLLEALEKKGSGELVTPYHGTVRVQVKQYRVRETREEGGIAKFTITFDKTIADPAEPTSGTDGAAAVKISAAAATSAIGVEFLQKFQALAPSFVTSISTAINSIASTADRLSSTVHLETQALAGLKQSIGNLSSSAASLAALPNDLLAACQGVVEAMGDAFAVSSSPNPSAKLLELYSFNPGVRPPSTTANRAAEQANFDALQRLMQRLALVQAATVAITQSFASYEDAVGVRQAIVDLIDDQAEIAADDTFPELQQLRADLIKAVPGDSADLPRLLEVTPEYTIPSLVLAYNLYGDLSREAELLARNRVRHAGFVAGGVTLEVLSAADDLEKLRDA